MENSEQQKKQSGYLIFKAVKYAIVNIIAFYALVALLLWLPFYKGLK